MVDSKTAALWGISKISGNEFIDAQRRSTAFYRSLLGNSVQPVQWSDEDLRHFLNEGMDRKESAICRIMQQPFF